jgi:elongation factor G
MGDRPLLTVTLRALTESDRQALDRGLIALRAEDPALTVQLDKTTGLTTVGGVSELHLEIVLDRLKREHRVEAAVGRPQVVYKEAFTRAADGEMRYVAPSGARAAYAHAKVRVHPGERGSGFSFINRIAGDAVPARFVIPVEQGIRDSLTRGILAGYAIDDVRVELYDGSYHDVDSSELAFRIAGSMAFQDAARRAAPILLEPMMRVEVTLPPDFTAGALADLAARSAVAQSCETRGSTTVISACVPLARLFGYAGELRSRTLGRGSCTMRFDRYEPVSDTTPDDAATSGVRAPAPREPRPRIDSAALPLPDLDEPGPV